MFQLAANQRTVRLDNDPMLLAVGYYRLLLTKRVELKRGCIRVLGVRSASGMSERHRGW